MSLQSEFSLSLELTRILGPATVSHAGRSLVQFARSLQRTGSDFIMEEDLATLFSRFHVDTGFVEEFKQRTLANTSISKMSDFLPVALQAGPGPSLQRAIKDPAFMPMVVHLSMFAATHELDSFSEALSEILARRSENDLQVPYFPSKTIKGTMQACAEQTSGYKWHYITDTIVRLLQLPSHLPRQTRTDRFYPSDNNVNHFFSLSWTQLNACIDILLAVQRVYSDNTMVSNAYRC